MRKIIYALMAVSLVGIYILDYGLADTRAEASAVQRERQAELTAKINAERAEQGLPPLQSGPGR